MVFHLDGKALVMRIQGGISSYSPGFEDAIQLKAQVIVQPLGVMLLDNETRRVDELTCAWPLGSRVKAKSRFDL